jgi:alcohol dehydrogenase
VGHSQNSFSHVQKMLNASNYAGKAINITKTTGPHAISYGLTKNLGLPHGHAVAITLGAFFIMHNIIYDTHKQELKKFKSIENFISKRVHEDLPKYLYALMDKFSMEYDIANLGLDEEKINLLITEINPERMANHPIKLDLIQLRKIFYLIPRKIDKFY